MSTGLKLTRRAMLAMTAGGVSLAATGARADDDYPAGPIRVIVPFSPGGGSDRLGRAVASFLPNHLNDTPVLVVNKPGAGGIIGHRYFLDQPDDGHFMISTTMAPNLINNILVDNAPYQMSDFKWINAQVVQGFVLCTPKDGGYTDAASLVQAIIDNPGTISTAQNRLSGGHLATVVLMDALGLPSDGVRLVTYDGGGAPVRAAVAGGQVDFTITSSDGAKSIADRVNFLGQFAPEPIEGFEDVPMINDELAAAGLPTLPASLMDSQVYQGIGVHRSFANSYPERFDALVAAYREMLEDDGFQRFARNSDLMARWIGPERTQALVEASLELQEQYIEFMR
jgi:tripartite-type tricarboxylate transporter receptor subunit TctC